MARKKRQPGAYLGGEMSFAEIGQALGVSHQRAIAIYQTAMRKLAGDAYAIQILTDWADYHRQLRARSAECQAARERL